MMPEILKQVGPQQYQYLKTQLGDLGGKKDAAEDDDDVPELVGTFEDAGKKKWVTNFSSANEKESKAQTNWKFDSKHWTKQPIYR